jgi:hypothetical protein
VALLATGCKKTTKNRDMRRYKRERERERERERDEGNIERKSDILSFV